MRVRVLLAVSSAATMSGAVGLSLALAADWSPAVALVSVCLVLIGLGGLLAAGIVVGRRVLGTLNSTRHYSRLSSERTAATRVSISNLSTSVQTYARLAEERNRHLVAQIDDVGPMAVRQVRPVTDGAGHISGRQADGPGLVVALGETVDSVGLERFLMSDDRGRLVLVTDQPDAVARLAKRVAVEYVPLSKDRPAESLAAVVARLTEVAAEVGARKLFVWPDADRALDVLSSPAGDLEVVDARAIRALLERDAEIGRSLDGFAEALTNQSLNFDAALHESAERGHVVLEQVKSGIAGVRTSVERLERVGGKQHASTVKQVGKEIDALYHQVEALIQLTERFDGKVPLPRLRGWAVSPDLALDLVDRVLRGDARLVLETGSGASTVLLAAACERVGSGRVIALEHDEGYALQTRDLIRRHGVEGWATVLDAPLVDRVVDGSTYRWYDIDSVELPLGVDLLVVDGPPEAVGPKSRFPAFPVLRSYLADQATIVLDDGRRASEHDTAVLWAEDPEIVGLRSLGLERDPQELRYRRQGSID